MSHDMRCPLFACSCDGCVGWVFDADLPVALGDCTIQVEVDWIGDRCRRGAQVLG
jgi:hypothetical protein